jgi:hypothetical protein
MRTVVAVVLALASATGCIGRASGHGPTIQAAPSSRDLAGADLDQRPDANQLPGLAQAR